MANEYRNLIIGFMLFGLFSVLLVSAIYDMGINYDVSSEKMQEATGGALDIDDYEAELLTSEEDTQNLRERFESGEVDDVDDASGVFQVAGDFIGVVTTPFNLLATVGHNLLGIPPIVTHVILSIINIIIFAGLWSLLRSGS